jgi:GNAT superfamily N-acetyltransferase
VNLELLDLDDAPAVGAAARLVSAARAELTPGEPELPIEELVANLRHPHASVRTRFVLARDADDVLGLAWVDLHDDHALRASAWLRQLTVAAAARGRGVGRALLDEVLGVLRADRRSTLRAWSPADADSPGHRFAQRAGATPGIVTLENRLDLGALDGALVDAWARLAPPGYSLALWSNPTPAELAPGLCRLLDAMNDAPRTPGVPEYHLRPEVLVANEQAQRARGAVQWRTAAIHDATGEPAGFTELAVRPTRTWLVRQGDTCVAPAHRGRGLGRWVKAVNLKRALAEHPEGRIVETGNAEDNVHMMAINRAMGFETVTRSREWALPV